MAWDNAAAARCDGTTPIAGLTSRTAVLCRAGKQPVAIRWAPVGDPKGCLEPQALLRTAPSADPSQILQWFVLRRPASGGEVSFQEARNAPILQVLFSWTTLVAHALQQHHPIIRHTAPSFDKPLPTFVDAIALARLRLRPASEC